MLVLTRKASEKIVIGNGITVSILEVQGSKVRVGIEAPPNVHILRGELQAREEKKRVQSQRKPQRILIVDDSPEDRVIYQRFLLKERKYRFAEAGSAHEGLEICGLEAPDCILLDYRMPDLTGLEFLAEVKKINHHIPVIMLTGLGTDDVAAQAMKYGAADYLVKQQLTGELLQRTVAQALARCWPQEMAV